MAVILAMTYSKKLGLPNFSSHSCSVSVTVEIADASLAAQESSKLYALLQTAVDNEIQHVGFMPDVTTYGMDNRANGGNRNGNGHGVRQTEPANGNSNGDGAWRCSDRQRDLIEKIVRENHLDKRNVEQLAVELFGIGVKQLDRLQASGLIDELLERHGGQPRGQKRPYRRERQPANGGEYS
jgi:hypothetical protein